MGEDGLRWIFSGGLGPVISTTEAVVAVLAGGAAYVTSWALLGWRPGRFAQALSAALGLMGLLAVLWLATYV
jgi:hypothetical protein